MSKKREYREGRCRAYSGITILSTLFTVSILLLPFILDLSSVILHNPFFPNSNDVPYHSLYDSQGGAKGEDSNASGMADGFEIKEGWTDDFLGGNYRAFKAGDDMFFGVVWGTENQSIRNSIALFSLTRRPVGIATFYDEDGTAVRKDQPVYITTLYGVRWEFILEYDDINNDSIFNFRKTGEGYSLQDITDAEPARKAVSLHTVWVPSPVEVIDDTNNSTRIWSFSLTARNLSYKPLLEGYEGVVESVSFVFHFSVSTQNSGQRAYPEYKIYYEKRWGIIPRITTVEHAGDRNVSASSVHYRVKTDNIIRGWDISTFSTNPKLLLVTTILTGNHISYLFRASGRAGFMESPQKNGTLEFTTDEGVMNYTEEDAESSEVTPSSPAPLPVKVSIQHPEVVVKDKWDVVNFFGWENNVRVYSKTTSGSGSNSSGVGNATATFQVQGHRKLLISPSGIPGTFSGFRVLAGLSYPAGEEVWHDPYVGSDEVFISISEESSPRHICGFFLFGLIIAAVLVMTAVVIVKFRRPPKENLMTPPDEEMNKYIGWDDSLIER